MNCKETRNIMVDYQHDKLDAVTRKSADNHISNCKSCQKSLNDFIVLFDTIDQFQEEFPDGELELGFNELLEKEKLALSISRLRTLKPNKKSLKPLLQIAAAILLMISGYLYGSFENNALHAEKTIRLEQEKAQMQTIATLSLIENESASKRLQAVYYAKALVHPDNDILNVLINKMNNDKHVNVRLAAANALSKFATNDMVRHALIKTLEMEGNASMQIELIQILVDIEDKRVIPTMKKLLKSTDTPEYIKEEINSELKRII